MNFIKFKGARINLDNVINYWAIETDKPSIAFLTTSIKGENTQLPIITWGFDSEERRDEVIKKIDQQADVREIATSESGDTPEVNAQVF